MISFRKLSEKSRTRKIALFYKELKPNKETKILDLGAEINPNGAEDVMQFIDKYPWRNNITAVNLDPQHINYITKIYPELGARVADACKLPFADNSYDIVYSNAVIEHVGQNFELQKQMAREIMRVGKSWFITTPNRHYPFEFHMRIPLITLLPFHGYIAFGRFLRYNHVKGRYTFFNKKTTDLRLLTPGEFKTCFPKSKIIGQKITFYPETLIAIGGK